MEECVNRRAGACTAWQRATPNGADNGASKHVMRHAGSQTVRVRVRGGMFSQMWAVMAVG